MSNHSQILRLHEGPKWQKHLKLAEGTPGNSCYWLVRKQSQVQKYFQATHALSFRRSTTPPCVNVSPLPRTPTVPPFCGDSVSTYSPPFSLSASPKTAKPFHCLPLDQMVILGRATCRWHTNDTPAPTF